MNILHVISGLGNGGAEAVLFRIIKSDSVNCHTVVSLSATEDYYVSKLNNLGVSVYIFPLAGFFSFFSIIFKLTKLISKDSSFAIQSWMYHASLIATISAFFAFKLYSLSWSLHATKLNKFGFPLSTRFIVRLLAFLSFLPINKIIFCSNSSLSFHRSLGYNSNKSLVIFNGVDISHFRPFNNSNPTFTIGHVSRFHPMKDLPNLFSSLSLLSPSLNFNLSLYGSGFEASNSDFISILNHYPNIKDKVSFYGPSDRLEFIYPSFDLFILSSAYGESLPNVLSEAMSCGVPCVTTDVGDSAFIVDECGWVVPPSSPHLLANAVESAFIEFNSVSQSWTLRKQNCRERIKFHFSLDLMLSNYLNIWSDYK